jgi:hypothetical protein
MLRKFDTLAFIKSKLDESQEIHREYIEQIALYGKIYKIKTQKPHYWLTLEVTRDNKVVRILFGRKLNDLGTYTIGPLHVKYLSKTIAYSADPVVTEDIKKYIDDIYIEVNKL